MGKSTVLAKISRPRLFDVVPRVRLFELLDRNRGRPLIWISAAPGSGKTALVASYLDSRGLPTIWYQLDQSDADPAKFLELLGDAAKALRRRQQPALPRLLPEHMEDLGTFSSLYFRTFFSRLPIGAVLVLDNFQEIPRESTVHDLVAQCAAEMPPDSSLICISRLECPASLVRAAASGSVLFVGWEELKMRVDEVQMVARQRGLMDDRVAERLHRESGGWAAGITLMLENIGALSRPEATGGSILRASVFNYFADLFFDHEPPESQQALLSIAFLPLIPAKLAVELSGRDETAQLLENLHRRRIFTDRRPGPEPVYQFHALFREFLVDRARQRLLPSDLSLLMKRTALALKGAGDADGAFEVQVAAKDWHAATDTIIAESIACIEGGRSQTLSRWILTLPESLVDQHPRLLYLLGFSQHRTAPEISIATLTRALDAFRKASDKKGCAQCLTLLLSRAFVGYAATYQMNGWLDELLGLIEEPTQFDSADEELRVVGVLSFSLFYVRPWHPYAEKALDRVEQLLRTHRHTQSALVAATGAVAVCGFSGAVERGARIVSLIECNEEMVETHPMEAAWWLCWVGYLRFIEARYEESLDLFAKCRAVIEANGLKLSLREALLQRFAVEFRVVGWSVANATLAEAEAMPPTSRPMTEALVSIYRARRAMHMGLQEEAAQLAALSYEAVERTGSIFQEMFFGLVNADVMIAAGWTARAGPVLEHSRRLIERTPMYRCYRASLLLVEGWMALKQGDKHRALARLLECLDMVASGTGKLHLRFMECAMPPMFRLALAEGIGVSTVRSIIRLFRLKPDALVPDSWPWPVKIYTLGKFEVLIDDEPIEFSRKLPRKTLLLLKAIVAHGGRSVPEQSLCDALWGDEEADAAQNALGITVIRLRKLLGRTESITYQGGRISLNPDVCWVDAWEFEKRACAGASLDAVLNLYGGTFLPEEEGEPWSVSARERLRARFVDLLCTQGQRLEQTGDLSGATACYLRGVEADPVAESFYQGLMRCYEQAGRRSEALSAYRRLTHTLSAVLGVPPSASSQHLFQQMVARQRTDAPFPDADHTNEGGAVLDIEKSKPPVNKPARRNRHLKRAS